MRKKYRGMEQLHCEGMHDVEIFLLLFVLSFASFRNIFPQQSYYIPYVLTTKAMRQLKGFILNEKI